MDWFRKLFGKGKPTLRGTDTSTVAGDGDSPGAQSSAAVAPPRPRDEIAVTPAAAAQLGALGDYATGWICNHNEFPKGRCTNMGVVVCGGCGRSACFEPYHVFCAFVTVRDGAPFEATGSKFHYYCDACRQHVCIYCLGIQDEYPCDPHALENWSFACPNCQGRLAIVRVDRVDYVGAAKNVMALPSRALGFPGPAR